MIIWRWVNNIFTLNPDEDGFEETILKIYEEDYINNHMGSPTIGKKYNKSPTWFNGMMKKYNLKVRSNIEKNKKYYCNEHYFDVIDSPDKAYWLGFMYADGYISDSYCNGEDGVGLSLSVQDIDHIYKLKECLNTNAVIHEYSVASGYKIGTKYCRLFIKCQNLADSLIRLGCVKHKTDILKPPIDENVNNLYCQDFIRGYMDGDGCITKSNGSYKIKFIGTDEVLIWIMDKLIINDILSHRYKLYKRKPGQIASSFEFGGNNLALKYCNYIYHDANMYLQRKYDKYNDLKYMMKLRGNV